MASARSANSSARNRPNGAAKPAKKFSPTPRAPSKSDSALWRQVELYGSDVSPEARSNGSAPIASTKARIRRNSNARPARNSMKARASETAASIAAAGGRDDGLVARAVQDDGELRAARLESNIGVDIAKAGRRAVVDEKQEFARQRFQRLIFGDGSREPRGDFIGVERSGARQRRRHDVEPAFRRRVRREQSDGFEARLRRGERCLADAAYLQLRALREIDPAIAATERDRGDFA